MRLIDADNLEFCGIGVFDHDGEPMMRMEDARESVNNATTIDATPVVRCRECLYWDNITHFCYYHSRYYDGGRDWDRFKDYDFCSYGERKEGAD